MTVLHILTLIASISLISFGLLTALEAFARLSISENDTKGLEWLLPLARLRLKGDSTLDDAEKNWANAAITAAGAIFIGVFVLVTSR